MLRDLNVAAAERVDIEKTRQISEEQRRIAASMHDNVGHLVALQQKVEYVEIGIIFVYTAELLNIFRESLELDGAGRSLEFSVSHSSQPSWRRSALSLGSIMRGGRIFHGEWRSARLF